MADGADREPENDFEVTPFKRGLATLTLREVVTVRSSSRQPGEACGHALPLLPAVGWGSNSRASACIAPLSLAPAGVKVLDLVFQLSTGWPQAELRLEYGWRTWELEGGLSVGAGLANWRQLSVAAEEPCVPDLYSCLIRAASDTVARGDAARDHCAKAPFDSSV